MTITVPEIEYLIHLLGGESTYNPKRLGECLSAEGSITLRQKLESLRDES